MASSLPRILDDKKVFLFPSSYVAQRQLKTPKITLSDLFPMPSSHLLSFRKYPLPSKCYRSPLKKRPFRIAFHPQRVRRTNRKRIERVILQTLPKVESSYSDRLFRSFESKTLPQRSNIPTNEERPRAFCMFLSKKDRREFFIPSQSVLQQKAWTATPQRDIKARDVAPCKSDQDLKGLIRLGFTGALASPREEGCIRDFLEARSLFPDDDKRREQIEKEATELKPRMTFTR